MTIQPHPTRDTRIDVFRALALLTIYVNHVPGNPFEFLTHKNFGFSDSAEAFVLISGIAVGLAYGLKFQPGNRLLSTLKAWRRAGVLYAAQLFTTMATLGIFALVSIRYSSPEVMEKINIGPVMNDTAAALVGLVTLGHQLGYNNILSMYAVVLLLLPAFLYLGSVSLRLMLTFSAAVWLLAGLYNVAPPNYPSGGYWFLNPLSWQFLFVIGIAGMLHVRRGGRIEANPLLLAAAFGYILLSLLWVRIPLWGIDTSLGLPGVLTGFNKTFLSLPRLLHVLALAYVIVSIPAISNLARTRLDNPLAVLGRHSLPVFVVGTILSMAAQAYMQVAPASMLLDTALVVGGIALQFALAYYLDWYQRAVRAAKVRPIIEPALQPPVRVAPQPVHAKPVSV
ncbi:OpgC domain-containing protein [Aquamicrobium sp. LC103]|uniref:OpgC family protein n=1 Tax=Aquamicrobium sp. LC103 TaxID=1120658 RepID=UPI00063E7BC3|nr:OpgC domain-containing protein [Aquamicrobium sp. LC103]TKT82748.1 hypothetical protein XW59_001935 [Aquamicrobium sp. LC103]